MTKNTTTKPTYSAAGRRLYRALRQVEALRGGHIALPMRYVRFSPRSLQEWEQGRRKPESAVRAYLLVIDRNPAAVQHALAPRGT